jgi:hercynylcysteine S-oxide lyase
MTPQVNVQLPLPGDIKPSPALVDAWVQKMLVQRKVIAPVYFHNDKWWTRVSAQIWVEVRYLL